MIGHEVLDDRPGRGRVMLHAPLPSPFSVDGYLVAVPAAALDALCNAASAAADVLGDVDPCDDALVRTLRGTVAEVRCHALAGV